MFQKQVQKHEEQTENLSGKLQSLQKQQGQQSRSETLDKTNLDPVLKKSLLRESGQGWQVVDFEEGIKDAKLSCDWTTFMSTSNKEAQMCVHPFRDIVSGNIRRKGRWGDCDVLPEMWNNSINKKENSIYVDIGANIGSCVMEMLLSTDAKIVAFEPHPMNRFNLMSTMSRLDDEHKRRLALIPIGLGDTTLTTTIFSANNNMGNSVIGKFIKDFDSQSAPEEL